MRDLPRRFTGFLQAACLILAFSVFVGLGAIALGVAGHVTTWLAADGKHVSIPWTVDPRPSLTEAEQTSEDHRRTRDASHLRRHKSCNCSLLFWKMAANAGPDSNIVNFLAGFNGCTHVTVDSCVADSSGPLLIESGRSETVRGIIDGPQYTPLRRWQGRTFARVYLGGLLDCERLYQDLSRLIADPEVRQKTPADWIDFALGRTDPRVLTCSGLIGQCILRQPASRLAAALRQAMQERITYGELTPNDLARAVAIEESGSPGQRFERVPVLSALFNGRSEETP